MTPVRIDAQDRLQPIGGQVPSTWPSWGPGQRGLIVPSEDVLLAVKRQVIDVFAHDACGQESRCGDAALPQGLGQRRQDRRLLGAATRWTYLRRHQATQL